MNEQISKLKQKLSEQDENDQEIKIYRKLKLQQNELKNILQDKKKNLNDLQKINIKLADQEMDMKASTYQDDSQTIKLQQLKARKEHLEKTHKLLAKELDDQRAFSRKLDEEHQDIVRQFGMPGTTLPSPSPTAISIEKMRITVKELEEKISKLESERRQNLVNVPETEDLTPAELKQIENEKKMNERLINEIIRLNEVIKTASSERDSTLL